MAINITRDNQFIEKNYFLKICLYIESSGAESIGAKSSGAESIGTESGGAESVRAKTGGAESGIYPL